METPIKFASIAHMYLGCELSGSQLRLSGEMIDEIIEGERDSLPILRPLSSMTDEEKIESNVIVITYGNAYYLKWLLDHCFDPFELISSGQAIDATTHNK